jgi:broad specificity phosphatase PhoE
MPNFKKFEPGRIMKFVLPFLFLFCTQTALATDLSLLRQPGYFALVRHARAPGTGDPKNFQLDRCETQRNLSAEGRRQAKKLGERLRAAAGQKLPVFTSQWCRARETAKLLGLNEPADLPVLNSFFGKPGEEDSQTEALKKWINEAQGPALLVTHQVNITALTGVFPQEGEVILLEKEKTGAHSVVARIR